MEKKKVLITGITGGFGQIISKKLEKDFDVFGTTTQRDKESEKVFFLDFMTSPFPSGAQELEKEWEAVILNAGIAILGNSGEFSFFEMFKMLSVNVMGPWELMKRIGKHTKKAVYISSSCALDGQKRLGLGVYGATKRMMEEFLDEMFEKDTLFKHPGPMQTNMNVQLCERSEKPIWKPEEKDWESPHEHSEDILRFLLK